MKRKKEEGVTGTGIDKEKEKTPSSSDEGERRRIQPKREGMSSHKTVIPKLELYSGKNQ